MKKLSTIRRLLRPAGALLAVGLLASVLTGCERRHAIHYYNDGGYYSDVRPGHQYYYDSPLYTQAQPYYQPYYYYDIAPRYHGYHGGEHRERFFAGERGEHHEREGGHEGHPGRR